MAVRRILPGVGIDITISSKGQVVIPKDIRDALRLKTGETLSVSYEGRRIVMEAMSRPRETMSYEEFKARIPAYDGPRVSIEDMNDLSDIFKDWTV